MWDRQTSNRTPEGTETTGIPTMNSNCKHCTQHTTTKVQRDAQPAIIDGNEWTVNVTPRVVKWAFTANPTCRHSTTVASAALCTSILCGGGALFLASDPWTFELF